MPSLRYFSQLYGRAAFALLCGLGLTLGSALYARQADAVTTLANSAADTKAAATLRIKMDALKEALSRNAYQRPLVLESSETKNGALGEVYAVLDYPFASVDAALDGPAHWCEVMMLHVNNRFCQAHTKATGSGELTLKVTRTFDQSADQAVLLPFAYQVKASTPDYFAVTLTADVGPFGTYNHCILLEAISLPTGRSFLHFAYSYDLTLMAEMAMKTYFSTVGASKMGFTALEPSGSVVTGARPNYIRGMRGLMERNAMRYYLAVDAYLASHKIAPAEQQDWRLNRWFTSIEQYPMQLHEMDRATYLKLKRLDFQSLQPAPAAAASRP